MLANKVSLKGKLVDLRLYLEEKSLVVSHPAFLAGSAGILSDPEDPFDFQVFETSSIAFFNADGLFISFVNAVALLSVAAFGFSSKP
ncbi:hypothetical protein RRG08_066379 [Elysia crispata]|uniref:Uncharacterized protein n=1 Tax=Elysia crispata TaxID=231223 RepID=A0AAE0Y9C6_9GAST|nr:hypothetical protein RRG08_066379 [Elysia crispata]